MYCNGGNLCIAGSWGCDEDDCHYCWFEEGERMMDARCKSPRKDQSPTQHNVKEWKSKYSKKEWKELKKLKT